jgi:hypothetical protein
MRKHLKYLLISLFLLALVVVALPFLAAPWACHIGGDIVCFGGVAEVTGSVWGAVQLHRRRGDNRRTAHRLAGVQQL